MMSLHRCLFLSALLLMIAGREGMAVSDDFTDAMMHALSRHPALKAEREAVGVAGAEADERFSGFLPNISANYDRGRRRAEYDNRALQYGDVSNQSLTVSQPLFSGGETLAEYHAARARLRAEEARMDRTGQEVLLNAVTAYVRLAEAEALLEINRDNVEILRKHVQGTRARFKAQDVSRPDVSLSESRLLRAQTALSEAEKNFASAQETYEREIGRKPTGSSLPTLPDSLPRSMEETEQFALDHPALQEAKLQHEAAENIVDARQAAFLPDVSLEGRIRKERSPIALSGIDRLREDSVMLRVSIPIFQSGTEHARLSAARHQSERARHEASNTGLETRENALRAWHDLQASRQALETSRMASEAAEDALSGMQEEFQHGMRTVLDVLDSQQELFTARSEMARTKANQIIHAYRLLAAIGKLTVSNLPAPDHSGRT